MAIQQQLQASQAAMALPAARQLAMEASSSPDAHQLLGLCLAQTGDLPQAEQALRRALSLVPGNPMVLANLATVLGKQGRADDAVDCWRASLRSDPNQAQAWRSLGLLGLQRGDASQAVEALQQAVRLAPGDTLAWQGLGQSLRLRGELDAAEAALRTALRLNARDAQTWMTLGAVRRLQGRADDALQCYDQARQRGGQDWPELEDATAGALDDLGQGEAALACARRLTRLHPNWPQGYVTLTHLLWEHGQAPPADADPLATFRAAAQSRPHDTPLQRAWLQVLLQTRRGAEALAVVAQLSTPVDDPQVMLWKAEGLVLEGRSAEAGLSFARALNLWGAAAPVHFLNSYTRYLLTTSEVQQALAMTQAAIDQAPYDQEAWAYRALCWRLLGDAREHWLCDPERLVVQLAVEPPAGWKDMPTFLTALKAVLEPLHGGRRTPMQQSVRGGSQSPGRLFGRADPVLQATQQALQQTVQRWLQTLPVDASHPFLSRRGRSTQFAGSWSVRLWSAGHHAHHIHAQGWISSAFHVSLPESVRAGTSQVGWLQLGQPPDGLRLGLGPRRTLQPRAGSLVLFPSYMWHGTTAFTDTQPRLSVAFDLLPRG